MIELFEMIYIYHKLIKFTLFHVQLIIIIDKNTIKNIYL